MYIYKSCYNCIGFPSVTDKDVIMPELDVIKFKILVIPNTISLYSIISDTSNYSKINMVKSECYIYIGSDLTLNVDILKNIEEYISKNISEVSHITDNYCVDFFEYSNDLKDVLKNYKHLTLFIPDHTNDLFTYINYRNNENNTVNIHDSIINYKQFEYRNDFSTLCGKMLPNKKIGLFTMFPLFCSKVYILPDEFMIIKESNNKIATLQIDNFCFWLVTHHQFLNNNTQQKTYSSTKICPHSLDIQTMSFITNTFQKYDFFVTHLGETFILGEDTEHSMIMFIGLFDFNIGNEYVKYFENLIVE
ncbi:CmNV_034-like protein [Aratus pisonii nudivirus]|nr:CmNV_034-like protein [Aratus pisonii nudivirus]